MLDPGPQAPYPGRGSWGKKIQLIKVIRALMEYVPGILCVQRKAHLAQADAGSCRRAGNALWKSWHVETLRAEQ